MFEIRQSRKPKFQPLLFECFKVLFWLHIGKKQFGVEDHAGQHFKIFKLVCFPGQKSKHKSEHIKKEKTSFQK